MPLLAPLANRFLPAFLATLEELADEGYFARRAGDRCTCGQPYFWTAMLVKRSLTAEAGMIDWPLAAGQVMPDDRVITYIEAFYHIVAKPKDIAPGWSCGVTHAGSFNVPAGRYDYTCRVNALLERFGTGLWLHRGEIVTSGSASMSRRLDDDLPFGTDLHMRRLVTEAIGHFRSPDPRRRSTGVMLLAGAFERVKSVPVPGDKAASAKMLVGMMSPEPALAASLDALLRALTGISNEATVRHHELGKAEIIDDPELVEFLFFLYYNVIRLALDRLEAQRIRGRRAATA